MGILDSIFAGDSGLVSSLHNTLGGTATIKIAVFQRNAERGTVETQYQSYEVPFVPASGVDSTTDLNAPGASRNDYREPLGNLSGTIPTSALDVAIRPEKDLIELNGVEYLITNVDVLRVGNADAMYSITATRTK